MSGLNRRYLVKRKHLSSHLAAVHQRDSHPVVDLELLAATDRVFEGHASRERVWLRESTYVTGLDNTRWSACNVNVEAMKR